MVVIGAGQAGLAMSQHLGARSIDHVVLDRGDVGQSWRTERWDSLRLLTPNWMTRLPGHRYEGGDPEGFMTKNEFVGVLESYARRIDAPVVEHVEVLQVRAIDAGFEVATDNGTWRCDAVVAATGASSEPRVPPVAAAMPSRLQQLTALQYRNPSELSEGGVLVVGASASGVQISSELRRTGREVTVAVGEHVRVPRTYRGRDIHWWMNAIGQLDERYDEVDDIDRARRLPSLQLTGGPERSTLDVNTLASTGVRVVGKVMRVTNQRAQCSGALANVLASADLKQNRLLERIDTFARERALDSQLLEPSRPAPTRIGRPELELDLSQFASVVWATGYRPRYGWLDPAAFDRRGHVAHDGGVCALDGLYLMGLPFMRRRKSSFIDGVASDAADLASHLHAHLDQRARV